MIEMLRGARPFIGQFAQTTNLVSLFEQVNHGLPHRQTGGQRGNESLAKSLPALERIVSQAHDALLRPGVPPSPNVVTLAGQQRERRCSPAT